jgi:hypothetical protein
MNKYRITLNASYCYETYETKADNISHLLIVVSSNYHIDYITKIELIK